MKIRRMRCLNLRAGWWFTGMMVLFFSSCNTNKVRRIQSPPHYNFGQVFTHKLDPKLKEISGLAWDNKLDEFIAHNDESGKLFYLDKETKALKSEVVFGGKGDYEDVAVVNSVPYVLRSDGLITMVAKDSTGKAQPVELGMIGIGGKNDFESMYYDPSRNALIILCKNCESDNKQIVSAYACYLDSTGFDSTPVFSISVEDIKTASPFKSGRFEPSAAAIHPVLQKLFILSSASNQLVITGLDGKPEGVYELGKKLFPQPEGITFKSNGDMYISNEGRAEKATILRFPYRK
jgi:uncharacterized protein YjiK